MKRSVARLRAQRYRRRGVPLKKHELEQGVELLPDWKELAEYAARLVPPGDVASGKDGDQERDDEDGGAEEGAA